MAVANPVDFTWDTEDEIQLFFALDGLRPFGQNKHFNMALLVERLVNKLGKEINSTILWAKLKTMYNLAALDELEPPVVDAEESDFALPESWCVKTSTVENPDDADDDTESKMSEKSETPASTPISNTPTNVAKEEEKSRTRNSTPARDTKDTEDKNSTIKRTQPKRTRASTSTTDTPNSSPSTPTPTGMKRRRI
ncbi:MRG/MORF4L-binding protein [Culicoides brevitarsis]|uniref:MRG/MORF4L-binding protein n=1 Tax=Culicoides brevitarsis TaxID=469753 RepID=UPI00307B62E2